MTAPHTYRVFARELGTFTVTAADRRTAVVTVALRLASLGLMTEKDAGRVRRWAVSDKVSSSPSPAPENDLRKRIPSENTASPVGKVNGGVSQAVIFESRNTDTTQQTTQQE